MTEQTFTHGKRGPSIRPFSDSAGVSCRGYSRPLQRAITDFGADVPFGRIPKKLQEHDGISVPVSSARAITKHHAEAILATQELHTEIPDSPGVPTLIAEMDGSMIPLVEISDSHEEGESGDRRKTRTVGWQEARLCLVHPPGSIRPIFGATLGSPEEAGDQLAQCAIRAGLGSRTTVHCVGDGAPWIADQVDRIFGTQASYLIDFYHLCEYLSAAGNRCAPGGNPSWMEQQKQQMKANGASAVLETLRRQVEPETVPDSDAPVRACIRYITNRPGQFEYQRTLAAHLPIGSGEIESAHRYVIQERLKIAGAWWKRENAQSL